MSDYQNIFNTSIDVIFIHHAETGEVLFVNERFKELYGYSSYRIIEEGLPLIFPLEYSFEAEKNMNYISLAAKGEESHFEMKNRHADGHEFWVEVRLRSVFIDGENRVMAIVRDITDKKATVASLEKSIQFQKTLNFFTTSLINKNTEITILEDVVEKSVEVFGFEDIVIYLTEGSNRLIPIAASGKNSKGKQLLISDVMELNIGEGLVGTAAEKMQSIIVNDLTNEERYVVDVMRRSSEISVPIIYQGQVLGVIDSEHSEKNFYNDLHLEILEAIASLTAIKLIQTRSENQVRNNEKKLKSILDSSPDIIYVIDASGVYKEVYTDDLTKLVASREQLVGKSICDFFPEDFKPLKKTIKRVVKTKKTETVEFTRLRSNGEKAWFSANITFFEYQTAQLYYYSVETSRMSDFHISKLRGNSNYSTQSTKISMKGFIEAMRMVV